MAPIREPWNGAPLEAAGDAAAAGVPAPDGDASVLGTAPPLALLGTGATLPGSAIFSIGLAAGSASVTKAESFAAVVSAVQVDTQAGENPSRMKLIKVRSEYRVIMITF